MPTLANGDVVPSFLSVIHKAEEFSDGDNFDNSFLRLGEVQDIVYPSDSRSRSKKFIEYRVLVQQRSRMTKTGASKLYEACLLSNPMGSLADRVEWTLRADKAANRDKTGLGKGSKVLLLCINGETNRAIIIGGFRDQTDTDAKVKGLDDTAVKDLGHHLYFNFNGISFYINKDGEAVLSYNGLTKVDGTTDVDSKKTGSGFKMQKNGNVRMEDRDAKNVVMIDHENSKVVIARDKAFELGDATDKMLLGESHRNAQQKMHARLQANFLSLQSVIQGAAAALKSAGSSMTVPVVGAVSAAPQITLASGFLDYASQYITQLKGAVDDFEQAAGQKNGFLSKKNKAD